MDDRHVTGHIMKVNAFIIYLEHLSSFTSLFYGIE